MPTYQYDPQELVHPDCPNFKMYEVFKSDTASRLGIDNTAGFTEEHRANAAALVYTFLQPLRRGFGSIKPSSWYRCEELELQLCEASYLMWKYQRNLKGRRATWEEYFELKRHPTGGAVDFELLRVSNDRLFQMLQDNKSKYVFDQLIREYATPGVPNSGWVHLAVLADEQSNRRIVSSIS